MGPKRGSNSSHDQGIAFLRTHGGENGSKILGICFPAQHLDQGVQRVRDNGGGAYHCGDADGDNRYTQALPGRAWR